MRVAGDTGGILQIVEQFQLAGYDTGQNAPRDGEQFGDRRTAQRVGDGRAVLAWHHQVGAAQHGELLRQIGGLDAEVGEQLRDVMVPLAE